MSQLQNINVGNIANDGSGDDLREAFIKVKNNLLYLENATLEPLVEGNNLGGSGEGIYASKDPNTLNFKELIGGNNVSLSSNNDSITINSAGGISDILIMVDDGHVTLDDSGDSVPQLDLFGGSLINTRPVMPNRIFIDLEDRGILAYDQEPALSSSLEANSKNINNAGTITADLFQGPIRGTVYDVDIRNINEYFDNNWEFGAIVPGQITSFIEYLTLTTDLDLGSIAEGPDFVEFDIDLGGIIDE
jgi:hypothetical protein